MAASTTLSGQVDPSVERLDAINFVPVQASVLKYSVAFQIVSMHLQGATCANIISSRARWIPPIPQLRPYLWSNLACCCVTPSRRT